MIPISIAEFVKQTVGANSDTNASDFTDACREMLRHKRNGAICGKVPIWAVGSAVTGTAMCFTCMTGDFDDGEDYEIESIEK